MLIVLLLVGRLWVPRRTAHECRVQWENNQSPLLVMSEFTKQEDAELLRLAERYRGCNWPAVAHELGTRRPAWLCFRRYQRHLKPDMKRKYWSDADDAKLHAAVHKYGADWQRVAFEFEGRTGGQCLLRWRKSKDPSIRRAQWQPDEDVQLKIATAAYGVGHWVLIARHVPGRTDVQWYFILLFVFFVVVFFTNYIVFYFLFFCFHFFPSLCSAISRERYMNILHPGISSLPWTEDEDHRLLSLAKKHERRWCDIAAMMPGRTDNNCWRRYRDYIALDLFFFFYCFIVYSFFFKQRWKLLMPKDVVIEHRRRSDRSNLGKYHSQYTKQPRMRDEPTQLGVFHKRPRMTPAAAARAAKAKVIDKQRHEANGSSDKQNGDEPDSSGSDDSSDGTTVYESRAARVSAARRRAARRRVKAARRRLDTNNTADMPPPPPTKQSLPPSPQLSGKKRRASSDASTTATTTSNTTVAAAAAASTTTSTNTRRSSSRRKLSSSSNAKQLLAEQALRRLEHGVPDDNDDIDTVDSTGAQQRLLAKTTVAASKK